MRPGDTAPTYRELSTEELPRLWTLDRRETIERMYRLEDGALVLRAERHDVRGWPQGEPEHYAPILREAVEHGGTAVGAFVGGELVGASVLEARFIGASEDRLQLKFLHVSRDLRGSGVGVALFERALDTARARGASQLYVSATPSQATVDFYLRRGCRLAQELDPALVALEPEDIHMERLIA